MFVVAAYLLVALLAAGVLYYLGLPWSAALGLSRSDPFGQRTMLAGLGVLTVWSWQWLELTNTSLAPGLLVLAGLTLPAAGWAAWRRRPGLRSAMTRLAWVAAPFALSLPVFTLYLRDALGAHRPRAAAISNNDLPLYSLEAQHLIAHGFHAAGAVPGYDQGAAARNDVFGAFDLLGAVSYLTHLHVGVVVSPLLLLAMVLTVGSLARLVMVIARLTLPVALAVALVACSSSLYLYSVGQGFFSQLFGMALFTSLLAAVLERRGERRLTSRSVGEVALLLAGLLGMYPHMAFVGLPIIVGIIGLAALLASGSVLKDAARSLTLVLAGFAVVLVVDGTRLVQGLRRTFAVGSSTGGYGLGRARVGQILGLELFPGARAMPTDLRRGSLSAHLGSLRGLAAVVFLLVLMILMLRILLAHLTYTMRDRLAWCVAGTVLPLTSYYVFYAWYGVGYLPWKWLVFYQPVALASLLALAAVVAAHSLPPTRSTRSLTYSVQLLPLALMAAGALSVPPHHHQAHADAALAAAHDPRLRAASGVNIEATTRTRLWDAMWAGVGLEGKQLVFITRTYFPVQPPDPRYPTLRLLPGPRYEVVPPVLP